MADARGSSQAPAVRVRGLVKRYGSVMACDGVDLDLRPGEIHGVLGENGAGKSTLMKVLIGLVLPDEGEIEVHGKRIRIADPQQAAELGIGMVHQHFSLVEELRVWENVVLGERRRLDAGAAKRRVRTIAMRYGLDLDPDARVEDLTAGQRQRVEIVKCLRRDPSIVVFDEPTSVLTPQESEHLFAVLRVAVEREGRAVALVSHKLDEILRATDVVTILRRGKVVGSSNTADTDASSLAQAMVGRPVSLRSEAGALGFVAERSSGDGPLEDASDASDASDAPDATDAGPPVALRVRGARAVRSDGKVLLDGVDLEVRAGEIVGVAGVEGNGQTELVEVLSSLRHLDAGVVEVCGAEVPTGRAGAMAGARVGVIPEDRHDAGCVLDLSIAQNLHLGQLAHGRALGRIDRAAVTAEAERLIAEYQVACAGPDAPFRSLSGGNQQKVVLARELSADPAVLVASQPTHGLDVGAIEFMSDRLKAAAAAGVAVLLVSSELEEILHLADRIVVMFAGRVVGEMHRDHADFERIGLLMAGAAA
jgi:general nucleoside transport system ATP-binding protein